MVNIPTFKSRYTPQSTFTKPTPVRGVAENVEKVANFANQIADEKAQARAYEKGFEQQQQLGANNFAATSDTTSIAGSAFEKGARAAFVSNFKTQTENELSQFAFDNQYNVEGYKKSFDAYRSKALQNVPQSLLPTLTSYIDGYGNRLQLQIRNQKQDYDNKSNQVAVTNRIETKLPSLTNEILTNGFNTTASINTYSEILTSIQTLEDTKLSPITINNLKLKLKDDVIEASIQNAYNNATDKKAFIAKVQKGDVKDILEDLNETYKVAGFEFNTALTPTDANKISSKLNTILRYDIVDKQINRTQFRKKFKNWYDTSLQGLDAGEAPSIEEAQTYLFDKEQLSDFKKQITVINAIAPDINKSRYGTLSESQNLLKESQAQYNDLLRQKPNAQRNEDLLYAQEKVKAIKTHVEFKQKAINEGNPFKILSQQGINYGFDNEQEIERTHELVKTNIGVSGSRMLIMPKENLEAIKVNYEGAETQAEALAIAGQLKTQFGKYENHFLSDVKFTAGNRVVFDFVGRQDGNAGVIWQSLKDQKALKTNLQNSRTTFTEDEKEFAEKFAETYGGSFRGNEDLYNEVYAGAYAYYLKTLSVVGDNNKAIDNTIKLFGNEGGVYQYVDINDQSVFIPPGFDGIAIRNNVEDMLENPHRYNITSGANFTLQDIVENKEEYSIVSQGGTIKLVQNSNVLFAAEIFQKLPSGSKQFVYTDVMVNSDDAYETETSMIDFDETWSFDKPKNLNSKIDSQIKTKKTISGGVQSTFGVETLSTTTREVDTNAFEKVTQLKEIVYKNVATDEGMPYADVFSGDIGVTTQDIQNLNAISLYIKDANNIPNYVLDYLSNFDYLSALKDKNIQTEVLKQWKDQNLKVRTTSNVEAALMTPLQSLTDIVRSVDVRTFENTQDNLTITP